MRRTLLILVFVAALVASLGGSSMARSAATAGERYIVVFDASVDAEAKTRELERAHGFVSDFHYEHALKGFAARLDAGQLARIESDAAVAFVSRDGVVRAVDALAPGESTPTGTRRIAATTSTTAQPAATVNVAVIDTGIDLTYTSELNAFNGKNCITPANPPQDDNGHGTHVAGTISARNTGTGVVGVAPGTKVYAVKVLDATGSGSFAQVICGIDWVTANAAALNIKVASMSLSGGGSNDNNCGNSNADAMHQAICNSVAAGVAYAVAAGNSGVNFSSSVPAAYPEAVTVTAVSDSDGQPGGTGGAPTCRTGELDDKYATFSNFAGSSDTIAKNHTIAAPGVCINSTWLGGGYNVISGTSMATPHVSGAIALCLSSGACTAGSSAATLVSKLQTTDASKGFIGDPANSPVSGRYYGYILWLGSVPPPTAPGAPTLTSATGGSAQVTLNWTAPSSSGGSAITNYRIYRGTSSGGETVLTTVGNQLSYVDSTVTNGTTYWYKVSAVNAVAEGPLSNELSATPQAGPVTVTFNVSTGSDDGDVGVSAPLSGGYPPSGTAAPFTDGTVFTAGRRNAFGEYEILVPLLRFDTSAIPDGATVTGASLKLRVNSKADGNNRNLVGEWYAASSWPIDAADYTATPSSTAFGGGDITAITTGAVNNFALQGLSSVSLTGFTALRLHIDGGAPSADNYVQFASSESGSTPQLVVTYSSGPPPPPAPPVNTGLPIVSGNTEQGQTLTTSNGTWSGNPTSFTYQWRRCDTAGNNCSDIAGATANAYLLTGSDVGSTLRARVTATNADGSTPATSAQTAVVTGLLTFTVLATGDDGDVASDSPVSGGYPPTGTPAPWTIGSTLTAGRRNAFGEYSVLAALVRFDTSALPDNATVTSATLKLRVNSKADADNRNLVGEWYGGSNWPIDAGDYSLNSTANALSGVDITALPTAAVNNFALQSVVNVSKTGYTGLRLHVDGGAPTGDNYVQFASFDNTSSLPKPQLVVAYTIP